jgi:hypothetical protein
MTTLAVPQPPPAHPMHGLAPGVAPGRTVVRARDVGGPAAWQALVRDGVLRRLTPDAACAIGTRVDAPLRASLVAPLVPSGAVVTGRTAAWIHAGTGAAHPLELACAAGRHRPDRPPGARLWQAPLLHPDTVRIAGVRVTDPTRTVVELALHGGESSLVAVLARCGADLEAARRSVLLRPRAAHRAAAVDVIDAATRL